MNDEGPRSRGRAARNDEEIGVVRGNGSRCEVRSASASCSKAHC